MRPPRDLPVICVWEVLCSFALFLFATNAFSSTIRYEYDLSGQLIVASYTGAGRTTFTYDDAGNMTAEMIVVSVGAPAPAMLLLSFPPESSSGASILNQ